MATKFAKYKSSGLSRVRCNVGGLLQDFKNPKTVLEVKEALQVIWGNLLQGPIDKTVKDEGLCWSLELSEDTSDHYLTVLFQQCY